MKQGTAASNDRHWEQKNSTEAEDRREEEVIFLAGGSSTDDDLSVRLQGLNRREEEGEEVTVLEKEEGQEVIHLDQEEEEVKSFLCFYLFLIPR
jgi:hypothetical protein